MSGTLNILRQAFFAGSPRFMPKDLPDLKGKVIVVTGANTGIGKEITQILYSKNARVYMMARSESKNKEACDAIQAAVPRSGGELICLPLDLADLPSINASAAEILRRESKLHVLFNNAGVGFTEHGSKTKQGYELQLGVNCLGTLAFTQQLTPTLISTARDSPPGTVRVVWSSSTAAIATTTKRYMERVKDITKETSAEQYYISKLGDYFYATEYASRHKEHGIISTPLNPGNLDSEFWRTMGPTFHWFLRKTVLYPTIYGAYTNIFAGFSPEVTLEKSGTFVAPWGRLWHATKDMVAGSKTRAEGGTGIAKEFWEWSEAQVKLHTK
ncbi:short-chain alcohol dehydrogenase [Fusarium falciforme]